MAIVSLRRCLVMVCVGAGFFAASRAQADPPSDHSYPCDRWQMRGDSYGMPASGTAAATSSCVSRTRVLQASKADAEDFVIYRHMWLNNGTELGPLGRYQFALIAQKLPLVTCPLIVETCRDEHIDNMRREVIVNLLAARGVSDAQRVVVAYPMVEGQKGDEVNRTVNGIIGLDDHRQGSAQGQGGGK